MNKLESYIHPNLTRRFKRGLFRTRHNIFNCDNVDTVTSCSEINVLCHLVKYQFLWHFDNLNISQESIYAIIPDILLIFSKNSSWFPNSFVTIMCWTCCNSLHLCKLLLLFWFLLCRKTQAYIILRISFSFEIDV